MIVVTVHLFHRKIFFLTDSAVWSLWASCQFKLCAYFTIIFFGFRNVLKPITYYVETCVAEITINYNIIFTIRWTETYLAVCLEFLDLFFRLISLFYISFISGYIIKIENSTTFIFVSLDKQFHDSWPIELLFHGFNICFFECDFSLWYF